MSRKPFPQPGRRSGTVINTGSAEERRAAWAAVMRVSGTAEIEPDLAHRFTADLRSYALGNALAVRVASDTYRFRRDRETAARVVRDQVFVNFVERGRIEGRMAGQRTVVEAGGVLVTRHGVTMNMRAEDATWYGLLVPMSHLARLMDWRPALDAKVFAPGSVSAVLVGHHLRSLMELPDDLPAARAERVAGESLRFLLPHLGGAARAADGADTAIDSGAGPTDDDDLRYAIRRFIADRLADPGLGVPTICGAFALSRSQLYRLFERGKGAEPMPGVDGAPDTGAGVAAIIRRLRLLCAHRDLADPSAPRRPIGEVGARWGLPDERTFRRSFLAQFGYPPSQVRKSLQAIETPDEDGTDGIATATSPMPLENDAAREIERWFAE